MDASCWFFRYPLICLSSHLLNPHLRYSNLNRAVQIRVGVALAEEGVNPFFEGSIFQFWGLESAWGCAPENGGPNKQVSFQCAAKWVGKRGSTLTFVLFGHLLVTISLFLVTCFRNHLVTFWLFFLAYPLFKAFASPPCEAQWSWAFERSGPRDFNLWTATLPTAKLGPSPEITESSFCALPQEKRICEISVFLGLVPRCVQLAGFFGNVILAYSELTAINRLQVGEAPEQFKSRYV